MVDAGAEPERPHPVEVSGPLADRRHDEALLATQHLIYDDEAALLESARQARSELEQLFEADVEDARSDDAGPGPR